MSLCNHILLLLVTRRSMKGLQYFHVTGNLPVGSSGKPVRSFSLCPEENLLSSCLL